MTCGICGVVTHETYAQIYPAKTEPAQMSEGRVKELISHALRRTVVRMCGDENRLQVMGWAVDDAEGDTPADIVRAALVKP